MQDIYIIGGYQTDFATHWARENRTIFDLFAETVQGGLTKTKLNPSDLEVGHIGNFVGELFTGQGQLGGFFGHVDPALAGMPATRHEGACASGSLALLAAMSDLESGRYSLACVVGIEFMRNVPGHIAADHLGAASFKGQEAEDASYVWPAMFSDLAQEYDHRYGLSYDHLMAISQKNFTNAKRNLNAQTKSWTFSDDSFTANDEANPVVEGWMRRQDCAQITDGAAVVFLATAERAKTYATKNGVALDSFAKIRGWGHTTAPMKLQTKITDSKNGDYIFPWTRKAITDAYARAGISGVNELDAIETHDCFSITEYMAIEHFGISPPGQAWKAIEEGVVAFDGTLPVNPSGGLIGLGHPVGATGVRMVLDAAKQCTGTAGDYQVPGAKTVATFNVGGSGTTNCSFVVGM